MIKINLLPHFSPSQSHGPLSLQIQVAIGIGVLCVSLIVCWIWGDFLFERRDLLVEEKQSKSRKLMALVEANRQGENLKKRQDLLLAKTHSLTVHNEQHAMPIAVLDKVSNSLEPLELWLLTLSIDQPDVSIEGLAVSSTDVSTFIGNLEDSSIFGKLIRMETHPRHLHGSAVQHFTIKFTTAS